ncbi:MAG TPA: M28 family peptidase [Gemmatimonadaceae bacterium]|nr:M28 family peptidase [Gemmatimonadaceae bacterium]
MPLSRSLRLGALFACSLPVASALVAQSASHVITAGEIDGDLRFLSSDLLEGRAPATRGGRLAAEYIAAQLRISGVHPGVSGSYFQNVPIDVVGADRTTIRIHASGKASANLRYPEDVVLWAGSALDTSNARGELMFVGYGAKAPEYRWDDFKGVDLKGKVLLVLVNDPPPTSAEPNLFGGKAMKYYGRWTYKFEEAERRGAVAALIVHTNETAGYPWHTVVGSWAKEQRMLPRSPSLPPPLAARGWITDSATKELITQAGLDWGALKKLAGTRDFRPVATGINIEISFKNSVQHLKSENVVGVIPGSAKGEHATYVAMSAHFDHLGIGPPVNGDSIYNGALDNASGVSALLAVARAAVRLPTTRRSLLFIFVTGEESGLLGSEYYASHPTVPANEIIADLNMDVITLSGRVRDLAVLGADKSTLGPMLGHLIAGDGMKLSPELHPEAGHFYRSDHFSFAKAGIPAVSIGAGRDYVGKPKGYGQKIDEDYVAHRYHQPSDEYRPDFDLGGAVQISTIVLRFARALANSPVAPEWNANAEFKSAHQKPTKPVS